MIDKAMRDAKEISSCEFVEITAQVTTVTAKDGRFHPAIVLNGVKYVHASASFDDESTAAALALTLLKQAHKTFSEGLAFFGYGFPIKE